MVVRTTNHQLASLTTEVQIQLNATLGKQDQHQISSISDMSEINAVDISEQDLRINERFHLYPGERLQALSFTSGIIGGLAGFYDGIKSASLRYLTENGHRLPKTVGGWYFYHKKKNYVMIVNGGKNGVKQGLKYSLTVGGFFGLEWLIDTYVRNGVKDFLSTTLAATVFSAAYGKYNNLSRVQVGNYVKKGSLLGLGLGLAQDALIYKRGGNLWYLNSLGEYRTKKLEA